MSWTERHRNRALVQRPIPWGNVEPDGGIPLITAQVVDFSDEADWPEFALAREHARQMKEARNGL